MLCDSFVLENGLGELLATLVKHLLRDAVLGIFKHGFQVPVFLLFLLGDPSSHHYQTVLGGIIRVRRIVHQDVTSV